MQTNNKCREALKAVKQYLDGYTVNILELRRKVDAALAAPPRNCDKSRDYILAALKREKNIDPLFTVRTVVDFMLANTKQ